MLDSAQPSDPRLVGRLSRLSWNRAEVVERNAREPDRIVIRVEDFPDSETSAEMGLLSPFELLGLYRGVSLDRKSVSDAPTQKPPIPTLSGSTTSSVRRC